MTNIFEALRSDHDIQRQLVSILVETEGDSDERRDAFAKLKTELTAHAIHEERHFYVPLMVDDLTQEKSRHSIAEHKEIDELVKKLESYEPNASQWLITAKELKHVVTHHLDEEEHEVFQLAGKALTEDQKASLARDYEQGMSEAR